MSKASRAGRQAYARARRKGFSVKESLREYSKAYSAIYGRTPKRRKYEKNYRKTWSESELGRLKHRDANSRMYLRKAIKIGKLIPGGWPDAGRVEQKIGQGFVTPNQWLRAAWAESQGLEFQLLFAETQIAALKTKELTSFTEYAESLEMLEEWNKLVRKLRSA